MTILLLAGTGEGRALAKFCAMAKLPVIASLAGVTRNPLSLDIPTRSGGFGDAAGFKQYLKSKNITAILKEYPKAKFSIDGYTDSVGNASSNQILSERRANTVRDFLMANGIGSDRLEAKGYGEANPIDSNKTRSGRANNRRVEVVHIKN